MLHLAEVPECRAFLDGMLREAHRPDVKRRPVLSMAGYVAAERGLRPPAQAGQPSA
ncbi:MAG: hypothetical protein ABI765_06005 [Gemmatimonadota bacterium]